MGGGQPAGRDNRPGGGLGAPIDSNDPLHDYRAVILGVFAVVLVMGGAFVISKSNHQVLAAKAAAAADFWSRGRGRSRHCRATATPLLLEAMKEELFQLEIDRQQGKVSAAEYATAKAALDETIKRALARTKGMRRRPSDPDLRTVSLRHAMRESRLDAGIWSAWLALPISSCRIHGIGRQSPAAFGCRPRSR